MPSSRKPFRQPGGKRFGALAIALSSVAGGAAHGGTAQEPDAPARTDYLNIAQGALPVRITTTGPREPDLATALQVIDGNPGGFSLIARAAADTATEFTFELPALTTFDRFAVPSVFETPSPSQTFSRIVELHGSATGPDGPWELLAEGALETHPERGMSTELTLVAQTPARWVKLRLVGGIEVLRDPMFFEFSEIIGNGSQELVPLADAFRGVWRDRGVRLELKQDVASVNGCYDDNGVLAGTVSGNVLRAQGSDPDTGIPSLFVLLVGSDGAIQGVRSTNGAPFRLYTGAVAPEGTTTTCSEIPEPVLGCGSVIHGINFGFDSAAIRDDSEAVLEQLFEGLRSDDEATITIAGHTSSEGTEAYNLDLSERRAQSVVDELVRRGIETTRIRAAGFGEGSPIASNDDEAGRALNRRVEVRCGGFDG